MWRHWGVVQCVRLLLATLGGSHLAVCPGVRALRSPLACLLTSGKV